MIKPECLKKNDKVAIVAPSVAARADSVNRAVKIVRQLGLKPVVYPSCYLIGDREPVPARDRAEDIMAAFLDDSVKGLIALKAELGILELLDHLDYEVIRDHPKVFVGFSDVTGLHLALNKLSGLVTFHGPTATTNIRVKGERGTQIEPYTLEYFEKAVFSPEPMGLLQNPEGEELRVLRQGAARGKLVGGNLTILSQFLGTRYELDTAGAVLFVEDFGESLDSLRAMLISLREAGKLDDCAALVVGTWIKCAQEVPEEERDAALDRMVLEVLGDCQKPVLSNLRSGHNVPMLTFPEGVEVLVDAGAGRIECVERAVREREN